VHITAVCPACRNTYQVEESLRGQTIRCPNTQCRKTFRVNGNDTPPAAPSRGPRSEPPPSKQQSGSVGDLVPILPTESLPIPEELPTPPAGKVGDTVPLIEAEAASPADVPDWLKPPPVRRQMPDDSEPKTPLPLRETPPKTHVPRKRKPVEPNTMTPGTAAPVADSHAPTVLERERASSEDGASSAPTWEPPPVRRPVDANGENGVQDESPAVEPPTYDEPAALPNRMARRMVLALVVGVVAVLGFGGYYLGQILFVTETKLREKAYGYYAERKFPSAAATFGQLHDKFPESDHNAEHLFMHDLSALRGEINDDHAILPGTLNQITEFIERIENGNTTTTKDLLKEHAPELGQDVVALLHRYTDAHVKEPEEGDQAVIEKYREFADQLRGSLPEAIKDGDWNKLHGDVDRLRVALEDKRYRDRLLARLTRFKDADRPADGIKAVKGILQEEANRLPDLAGSDAVKDLLNTLYERHRKSVVYREAPPKANRGQRPIADPSPPSIYLDPAVDGWEGSPATDEEIELALVRGVLYGVKRNSGKVRWARRVGIDITTLPIRVPPSPGNEERILVLSTDSQTLTALNRNGQMVWQYPLSAACLGRAVVLDQKAYLPTFDGQVHVIELAAGQLLGRFNLGQRLTLGGTAHPREKVIYFPADDMCLYELDVEKNVCKAILYSDHPAGTLRSELIVISPAADVPGDSYLILNQTAGLDGVRLRVFSLPITDRNAAEITLDPPPALRGWPLFAPYVDDEKLTMVSDAGRLAPFGIRQPRNDDRAIFPLMSGAAERVEGLDLTPYLGPNVKTGRGRAQVVQVQDHDYWISAHGRLQRLRLDLTFHAGPRLSALWREPRDLGSPVHASQVNQDERTNRSILYLVTKALDRPVYLATALKDEDGSILWQRQLGVVLRGSPLLLSAEDAPPTLLVQDQGGGLFVLDPAKYPDDRQPWRGNTQMLASSLADNPSLPSILLPGPAGHLAYQVASPAGSSELIVRRVGWNAQERRWTAESFHIALERLTLQGRPALVGSQLVLPFSNGELHRLDLATLNRNSTLEEGHQWRSARVRPEAQGFVVGLGSDRFLTTDGGRHLTSWHWPAARNSEAKALDSRAMKNRILSPPILLPGSKDDGPKELCFADAANVVTLLKIDRDGKLSTLRHWDLKGQITSGPWIASVAKDRVRLACIVEQSKLVWLDPALDEPLWEYATDDGAAIVGQPSEVEGLVIVGDQSGRIVGLEPNWWWLSGKPIGAGYELSGSIVPTTSPTAFGSGRLLVPLTDGTMMILKRDQLR
jgi:outer membrane protein assembly factor BamB